MKKLNFKTTLILISLFSIIIGMMLASFSFNQGFRLGRKNLAYAKSKIEDNPAVKKAIDTQNAFSLVAKELIPTVVNISSEIVVKQQLNSDPFKHFFGDDWFDFFFNDQPRQREFVQKALGSGVVVDEEGNILTNHHVVKNASKIKVKLSDGTEYKAKIVGVDPKTDLALIKIEADVKLKPAPIGDSDKLDIGHWAIAIGNPFGLNETFTVGIISAKGRSGIVNDASRYENYIQTDAPINPGNSGGPLVNIKGEVIGINTAIASPSGGNVGIGFAIPINMAKNIFEQLKEKGKVTRGWLGVSIQELTPDIAKHFNRKQYSGVLISDVFDDSPAKKGGLKSGDIIIKFDGKDIKDTNQLRNVVAQTKPGSKIKVKIIRDKKEKTLNIKITEMQSESQNISQSNKKEEWLGFIVAPITQENLNKFNLNKNEKGVVITQIKPGSPAQIKGLAIGDVIKKINNYKINNLKDFEKFKEKYGKNNSFLLIIRRKGRLFYLTIENEKEDK